MRYALIAMLTGCWFAACGAGEFAPDKDGKAIIVGETVTISNHAKAENCQVGTRVLEERDGAAVEVSRNPGHLVIAAGGSLHRGDNVIDNLVVEAGSSLELKDGQVPEACWLKITGELFGHGTLGLRNLHIQPGGSIALASGDLKWGGAPIVEGVIPVVRIEGLLTIGSREGKVAIAVAENPYASLQIQRGGVLRGAMAWPTTINLGNMAGTVIADGYGVDQDLDLRKLILPPAACNRADTAPFNFGGWDEGGYGWKAVNRGRLLLPAAAPEKDGSARIGQPGARHPTLVGAVRVQKAAKPVEAAILAADRDELTGVPGVVVSAWQLAGAAGSALELRYDDVRLRELGGDPLKLVAWTNTAKGWEAIADKVLASDMTVLTKPLPADSVVAVGFPKDGVLAWAKTDAGVSFKDPGPADEEFHGPFASWTDVTSLGAKGNGKADDTEAIQKAIDEVALSDAKAVVYLPKGTYRISKTLLLPSPAGMKKDSQGFANKALIGEDPASTTIVWDGPAQPYTPALAAASPREVPELVAPVAMLHVGIAHSSTFSRLTLDGKGKIAGLRVERFGAMYSSYGRVTDMRFVDCTIGFWNSDLLKPESDMDSEYSLLRLRFQRCDIGAAIIPGNGYDYWLREALFEDCRIGVYSKSGDFRVANSVFRRSREADVIACGHRAGGVRDNVSAGSRRFFVGGGNMVFQGNRIIDPVENDAFQVYRPWGMVFLDNQIRSRPGALGPVIHELDPLPAADDKNDYNRAMIAVGNRFTVADPIRFRSSKTFLHDNAQAKLEAAQVELPTAAPARVTRQVFEVTDAKDLQAAVDQAVAAAKAKPDARPVVHLAANNGKCDVPKTVEIPADVRLSIEGDGALSRIKPPGDMKTGRDPALRLLGPSRVSLSDLFFVNFDERGGAPMVEVTNADQKDGRIVGDNLMTPVTVQGLGETSVWLSEYMYGKIEVSGPAKPGPGFTAVFGGAGSGSITMLTARSGARVFASDVWTENGEKGEAPWALAAGAGAQPGELVLESMYLHQSTGPDFPFVVADGFAGNVSILGVSNTGAAAALGDASKTSWLDLRGESALVKGKPGQLGRFDLEGEMRPIDPKWLDQQLAFARKMRWVPARAATPEGATDLRLHRVVNLIGHHGAIVIRGEP